MSSFINLVKKRSSVRSYASIPVEDEKKKRIKHILDSNKEGPFGNTIKFKLVNLDELAKNEIKSLGTYGVIRGARLFIAGAVEKAEKSLEDYGFCLEKVILSITELGLGTCWLGSTFNKNSFSKALGLSKNEFVPAVTPVGYPSDRKSFIESFMKMAAGSKRRKAWEELFFYGEPGKPLDKEKADKYTVALESVRLAPSAMNSQPWRIIKEREKNIFHFYINRRPGGDADYKNIDIGIAMCHFQVCADEAGIKGSWKELESTAGNSSMEYIVSWVEK